MLVSIAVSSPQVSRVVIDQVFVQDLPESHVRPGHLETWSLELRLQIEQLHSSELKDKNKPDDRRIQLEEQKDCQHLH